MAIPVGSTKSVLPHGSAFFPRRTVVPDKLDLRDRPYLPAIAKAPQPVLVPNAPLPVLNQAESNACTGFALASVVHHLMATAGHKPAECDVSPYMLYSMARRYDEFPGDPDADTGSSLRGAMKGWFKHGVCASRLWCSPQMPPYPVAKPTNDWWLDAVRRPLGAYYRVDVRSVTDMHVALHEVGILYASAACHAGWDQGFAQKGKSKTKLWPIPYGKATSADGGHAFAIVGYNPDGFIIHNSWGAGWGTGGRALLTYEDWVDNAMDCWVAQMGVVTHLHQAIAKSPTLRWSGTSTRVATDTTLRNREISPFIINMENNGQLSNTGDFRTQEADIEALVTEHLGAARKAWGLDDDDPVDIAIYAHGGLVSEESAACTAATWVKALYDKRIFPIFLMWETDLLSTLRNRVDDILAGQPRPTGGIFDAFGRWANERIERLISAPGSAIWGEMKQNADAISSGERSGGMLLYDACQKSNFFSDSSKVRLHLIGHSAGAIVHCHVVDRLVQKGWTFETVTFMAPAARVDLFDRTVGEALRQKKIRRYTQFHLTDHHEQRDHTCRPILLYGRSLLYLVSRSFERGQVTPIVGLQKDFDQAFLQADLPCAQAIPAPGVDSASTTHGGFDDDASTLQRVIQLIHPSQG